MASANDLFNPPDVQKIIVEHVIKSDNSISTNQGTKRLRPFSGKLPKPPNEVDFQTWSLHVELMIQDKIPVDMQRRTILESLLPPASDLIRQLGPHADPCDYVKLILIQHMDWLRMGTKSSQGSSVLIKTQEKKPQSTCSDYRC